MALVAVWLHLLAVVTWMGGLVFGSHLVAPRLAQAGPAERGVLAHLLRRFRLVAWMAIALLVLTGLVNLASLPVSVSALAERGVGSLLALKLFLAVLTLSLAAHRDFALLPRLLAASPDTAGRPFAGIRWLDRIVLLLLLVILFLGLAVARGLRGA